MELAKKSLKIFSYLEIFAGVVFIGLGIYAVTNYAAVAEYFQELNINTESLDPKTAIIISCVLVAIFCFLYAYLARVAIKDGKKTTFLLVLLVLGVVGSIYSLINAFSIATLIGLLIDGFILYQVIVLRKAAQ